jgi:hypothetical protein
MDLPTGLQRPDDQLMYRVKRACGGPQTPLGKAKASGNSVTHGLRSAGVLLPGENEDHYAAHLEGLLRALAPVGYAETQAVAMLAERMWLQERWHRALRDDTVDGVRERVKTSPEAIRARQVDAAVVAFDTLKQALDTVNVTEPGVIPDLVRLSRAVLAVGREAELEVSLVADVVVAIDGLETSIDSATVGVVNFAAVVGRTRQTLHDLKRGADAKVKRLEQMLMVSAVPRDHDVKRLHRYGKMIDASVDQQLAILERLQQGRKARRAQDAGDSSLGRHDEPAEVRLRVIK